MTVDFGTFCNGIDVGKGDETLDSLPNSFSAEYGTGTEGNDDPVTVYR